MSSAARLSVNVLAWLEGKRLEDFQAIERGTQLLFPDTIDRRTAKGEIESAKVLIRVPGADDVLAARFDAIAFVNKAQQKHGKLKAEIRTLQDAREAAGLEQFEHLENMAIVARCLHEVEPPHQQWKTLDMLRADHLPPTIQAVFRRMGILNIMLDPNLDELTEAQFWAAVLVIGETQSISPLGVMRGNTEYAFLVRACVELVKARRELDTQRTLSSSSPSTETSTPES